MKWSFTTELTLEESTSGFIIYLLSGSWENPKDVSSKCRLPMSPSEKTEHLKQGLAFAKSHIQKMKNKAESPHI
jgi:hypothetical protein